MRTWPDTAANAIYVSEDSEQGNGAEGSNGDHTYGGCPF